MDSCTSPLLIKLKSNETFEGWLTRLEVCEILPHNRMGSKGMSIMQKLLPEVGNAGLKMLSDDDVTPCNPLSMESYMAHFPNGSSFKSIKHYRQMMNSKVFE